MSQLKLANTNQCNNKKNYIMRTLSKLIALFILTALPIMGSAQSLSYAKTLIEQGRYLEAAKQLRPLADGGNAEAQYWASYLFFEGKGVTKNVNQGVKYATLSANQGYEMGVCALFDYYSSIKNDVKAFSVLKMYTDKFPKLRFANYTGIRLIQCYVEGKGTAKNEKLGWGLFEDNNDYEWNINNLGAAEMYWNFKAEEVGACDMFDYADYLYCHAYKSKYKELEKYITNKKCHTAADWAEEADNGHAWAKAKLAELFLEEDNPQRAYALAKSAKEAGSCLAEEVFKKAETRIKQLSPNRTTNTYSKSSSSSATSSAKKGYFKVKNYRTGATDIVLTNIDVGGTYTTITLRYRNSTSGARRLTINPNTHIAYNGMTYGMKRNSVPPSGIMINGNSSYEFTITFPQIPSNGTDGFDLIENGSWKFYGITY